MKAGITSKGTRYYWTLELFHDYWDRVNVRFVTKGVVVGITSMPTDYSLNGAYETMSHQAAQRLNDMAAGLKAGYGDKVPVSSDGLVRRDVRKETGLASV